MTSEAYFRHPLSDVQSKHIGKDTRIWQYVVILQGARIGENCNINAHCLIENDVTLGDNVTVKCGNYLWDGLLVESDVFIGPNVTFTNDKFPRSKVYPQSFARTVVKRGASIGAGSIILPGITVGARAMVAAGSLVTKDVPDGALVLGSPARLIRMLDADDAEATGTQES